MALVSNRISDSLAQKARSKLGIRFGRFAVAAIAAFLTTLVTLTICAGPLALTATWASLIAWFSGALVSYVLSRWAWKRKGRPSLLKETLPFWVVSAMVVAILCGGHQVRLPRGDLDGPDRRGARALRGR